MAALVGARAFTRGPNIWLGPGASANDLPLMAHEATHVVQQSAARGRVGAGAAPVASARGRAAAPAPAAAVARGVQASLWDDVVSGVTSLASVGTDFLWGVLEDYAPRLVPIVREVADKGIFGYLRDKVSGVLDTLFDGLGDSGGFLRTLVTTFDNLSSRVGALLVPLARGDCGPLFSALESLKNSLSEMAGDAWSSITEFFRPVEDFFSGLWDSFGAPALDWLRETAGDVWRFISELGAEVWRWTRPVRDAVGAAWDWIKRQLGLGENEGDSEGGLVDWIGGKLGEVWDWIKQQLRPVLEPMRRLVARVREVLPLDAIVHLRDTIQQWLQRATSMANAMERPEGVVEQQTTLRGTILPAILESIRALRGRIVAAGAWVSDTIGAAATGVTDFLASLREVPLVRSLGGAIGWLADGVAELSSWARRTVGGLFSWAGDGLVYLSRFIEPILDLLQRIVSVLGNLVGRLPDLILGPLWRLIPACIRNPIKDFLINQILRRIPIFSSLLELPDIWGRVQAVALRILRQVFVDGNLAGAAWTFFSSLLELLGLPPELVTNILRKAVQAISDILGDPIGFLLNLLRALKEGFSRFFSNIGRHLLGGVAGWLFGQLRSAGINPPEDLSFRSILGFVLQVLDITTDRIFQTLARHIGEERARRAAPCPGRGHRRLVLGGDSGQRRPGRALATPARRALQPLGPGARQRHRLAHGDDHHPGQRAAVGPPRPDRRAGGGQQPDRPLPRDPVVHRAPAGDARSSTGARRHRRHRPGRHLAGGGLRRERAGAGGPGGDRLPGQPGRPAQPWDTHPRDGGASTRVGVEQDRRLRHPRGPARPGGARSAEAGGRGGAGGGGTAGRVVAAPGTASARETRGTRSTLPEVGTRLG